jgi:hypothetical protein
MLQTVVDEQRETRSLLLVMGEHMGTLIQQLGTILDRQDVATKPPPPATKQPPPPAPEPKAPTRERSVSGSDSGSDAAPQSSGSESGAESDSSTSTTGTRKSPARKSVTPDRRSPSPPPTTSTRSREEAGAISPDRGLNQHLARVGGRSTSRRRSTSRSASRGRRDSVGSWSGHHSRPVELPAGTRNQRDRDHSRDATTRHREGRRQETTPRVYVPYQEGGHREPQRDSRRARDQAYRLEEHHPRDSYATYPRDGRRRR